MFLVVIDDIFLHFNDTIFQSWILSVLYYHIPYSSPFAFTMDELILSTKWLDSLLLSWETTHFDPYSPTWSGKVALSI